MKKRKSEEQTSDSSTKPTMEELFAKHGIINATKENLGKTYIDFYQKPKKQ